MRANWTVALDPVGKNAGTNTGGLIVYLTDGDGGREEVTRVGFAREDSRHPEVPFHEQLQIELDKAQEAADVINDALDAIEREQAEAIVRARERVREILGRPEKKPA